MRRAIWSERATQGMKARKPIGTTPLIGELEKQLLQIENVMTAYGIKEADPEG